jgi:hypothetical protein
MHNMNQKEVFLSKYPELNDNGDICDVKLNLLIEYYENTGKYLKDEKILNILSDYDKLKRNTKIINFLNKQ